MSVATEELVRRAVKSGDGILVCVLTLNLIRTVRLLSSGMGGILTFAKRSSPSDTRLSLMALEFSPIIL